MDAVWHEIGIHWQHVAETSVPYRFQLICDKGWLQTLEKKRKIANFPLYKKLDRRAHPDGNLEHPWIKVLIQVYKKCPNLKAYKLTCINTSAKKFNTTIPLSYSQGVFEVAQANFRQIWEKTYESFVDANVLAGKAVKALQQNSPGSTPSHVIPYDNVLKDLIQIVYKCPIIHCQFDREKDEHSIVIIEECKHEPHDNVLPALITIETSTCFAVIFYPPCINITLYDCITYSPAILSKTYNKPLFIIYQILQFTQHLHQQGLVLGDICLQDIVMQDNLWIWIIPKLHENIIIYETIDCGTELSNDEKSNPTLDVEQSQEKTLESSIVKLDCNMKQFSLRDYCESWCNGKLSNFQYLTVLNYTSGRSPNNPYYHHIMPWVTDFNTRSGLNWRDLTKSKYRLCKGDVHLDLMFSQANIQNVSAQDRQSTTQNNQIPHHVSDFLSEITYFVYMARRTPQHILREHVRPIWVPAEYPVSIQRLQEWTPDECIPEFYTNPMIFKSIHEDLPDLELPTWASCPEDFVSKHSEALESQYVSERLHHWIDLNFGYKLTGKAAIKSKNVCLSMADQHKHLCQRGVVQLFMNPHPPKRLSTTWFSKTAPRVQSLLQKPRLGAVTKHLAKSSENLHQHYENLEKIDNISTHSMGSNSPRLINRYEQHKVTTVDDSNFYNITNFIELPKDYNPLTLLKSFEAMHNFITKTFPSQLPVANRSETKTNNLKDTQLKSFREVQVKMKSLSDQMQEKIETDLKILGCLIVELFCMAHLRPLLGPNVPLNKFGERLQACLIVQRNYKHDIPKCVASVVSILLESENSNIYATKGLAPITVTHLLEPIYFNLLIPFPLHYYACYALIRSLKSFEFAANLLDLYTHFHCDGTQCLKYKVIDCTRALFQRKIAECTVMSCCTYMGSLLEIKAYEQFPAIEILLPHIIELLTNEHTAILAGWNILDGVGKALGIVQTQKYLLYPMMKLYDVENFERERNRLRTAYMEGNVNGPLRFSTSTSFKSRKSVKLYHHSFLLKLIVRFGLRCFLQNFIAPLIEAVSGYKELEGSNGLHYHSSLPNSYTTTKNLNNNVLLNRSEKENAVSDDVPNEPTENSLELQRKLNKNDFSEMKCINSEIQNVFSFDDEVNNDAYISDRISNKSLDSMDIRFTTPDEAKENNTKLHFKTTLEKTGISEVCFRSSLSNSSLEEPDIRSSYNQHNENISVPVKVQSPNIAIPAPTFKETCPVSVIDCHIGSLKEVEQIEAQYIKESKNNIDQNEENIEQSEENVYNCSNPSIISEMYESKSCENSCISEMSSESLIWLSHRLGPVLTCRFISTNLLKMLSLCYVGQENLLPISNTKDDLYNINYFSTSNALVVGDRNAARILECLMSIAALYGEHVILFQYFSHITELISSATNRIGNSQEGAIISTLQLVKYLIPCLLDATIMEHLEDLFITSIMVPMLTFLSSADVYMPSGYLGRSVLSRKLLDAIYILCVRIGADMTRKHLCFQIIRPFFLIFGTQLEDQTSEKEGIRDVFSIDLAHSAYLAFLPILGMETMKDTITNFEFIIALCHEFEQPRYKATEVTLQNNANDEVDKPKTTSQNVQKNLTISNSFGTQMVGNRIEVTAQTSDKRNTSFAKVEETLLETDVKSVLDMVAYKFDQLPNTRHLKGNWLAYWRHEITMPDKDIMLNLKQIKLQSFIGHTNSVRSIFPLDNENSFISASKDKTVKLWSLRNEGDGNKQSPCQFTYTSHKKSIHSLSFLESLRLVVSCDSGIHLWDPFMGRPLAILDSNRHNPITVIKCLPSPSPLVLAGTAEASVKMIDARCMQYVNEWRINMTVQTNATVRCMSVASSGNWMALGLSCGSIVTLDTRTGLILNSWRPTECDLLQVAAPNEHQLISSALDHSLAVWNAHDGILQYQLMPPTEPAHFLQTIDSTLVYATTGNRIGIYSDLSNLHSAHSVTKLHSETFKGVLTSMAVLPLNRAFLAGNESGNISLFC